VVKGLPRPVIEEVEATVGPTASVEPLAGGQSGASVVRVTGRRGRVVVKSARPAELAFYARVAPGLRAAGVGIPEPLGSVDVDRPWLVLEDIPAPLPRSRWLADPGVMATLARLHGAMVDPAVIVPGFRPEWSEEMTEDALRLAVTEDARSLRPDLDCVRSEAQVLFAPRVPISGDPNPTNWGLRATRQVVLFDSERFTWATPALDLAISVPWGSPPDSYARVSAVYLGATTTRAPAGSAANRLEREIRLAKVWNVVEYLGFVARGEIAQPPATVAVLLDGLRGMVGALVT
jgi:hypothetical protein